MMQPTTPNSLRAGRQAPEERERKFQVICKVRPLQQAEPSEDIAIGDGVPTVTIFNHPKNSSKEFTFHRVYGEDTPQADFSRALAAEVLANCRQNGKGCLVLSYGVTNSGKTFTIFGNDQHPGLLPALVAALPGGVRIRAVEIYNDVIYCLRSGREVQWSDGKGIEECEYQEICPENAEAVVASLTRLRRTDETEANQSSSRSHAIFMVEWGGLHVAIADLAGNEKYGSNANFSETVKINGNLLVLGQCISAFRDGEFIPYRRSRLTQVLMEYFKPSYKIYMIAHLNRSGQMFHENLNVLEYAAISTQIRHLHANLAKNPAIAKSIRKNLPAPTLPPLRSELKTEPAETERKQDRFLLERYKCYIMGINAQAEADLDEYFKREDEKDRLFLEELKASKYESPVRDRRQWLEQMEAQSRMKLRQIFMEDARRELREKQVEYGTGMGESMIKNYLQKEKEQERPVQEEAEEKKGVDYGSSIGASFRKPEEAVISPREAQDLRTPKKGAAGSESGSYLKRVMNNPALMIQSGYRMITNLHEVANHMMDTFRGLVGQQRPPPHDPATEKQAEHLAAILSSKKVVVLGDPEVEVPRMVVIKEDPQPQQDQELMGQRQPEIAVQEIEFKDETAEAKAKEQKAEVEQDASTEEREQNGHEAVVQEEEPQLVIPHNSENVIPFDSQESTIFVQQEPNRLSSNCPSEEDTRQGNAFVLDRLRESHGQQASHTQNINAVSINIYVNGKGNENHVEESLLLDGLRSEKDRSTNRTSEIDLLRSESSAKDHLRPIQIIPELDNETATKPTLGPSNRFTPSPAPLPAPSHSKYALPAKQPAVEGKLNETGLKSTQQTFQTGSERSKAARSISQRKKSNKHRHCNSIARNSRLNSRKENTRHNSRQISVAVRSVSGIKTRNMRKNQRH